VFSAGGPDASLEAVAKTGRCRHRDALPPIFPTREALFEAVYRREGAAARRPGGTVERARAEPVDALRPLACDPMSNLLLPRRACRRRLAPCRARLVGTLCLFVSID